MNTNRSGVVWSLSVVISLGVHGAVVALAGAAWADRASWQAETLPLLSHRDISFLMGYVMDAAESGALADRTEPEVSGEALTAGEKALPVAVQTGRAPNQPRREETARVAAPPPPSRVPEPPPPPFVKAPDPRPDSPAEASPVAVDAGLVEALGVIVGPESPDLSIPRDRYLYMERLRQRIARNCQFLLSQQAREARGVVVFDVVLHRSGAIREIRYRRHSDYPALDVLAEQAVLRSAPFPPFYQAMDMQFVCFQLPIRFGPAPNRRTP